MIGGGANCPINIKNLLNGLRALAHTSAAEAAETRLGRGGMKKKASPLARASAAPKEIRERGKAESGR